MSSTRAPQSWLEKIRGRLSAEGYFGFQLVGGALAIIFAAALFGAIAGNITQGRPLTILDAELATWFHVNAITPLTRLMLMVSDLNGIGGILLWSSAFAVVLIAKREWYWLGFLGLAVPGGMIVNVFAKLAFHRERPSFTDPLVTLSSYSFPSGHTVASTLFYGTLAAFLIPRVSPAMRAMVIVGAVVMVVLVGTSRIYLGAHFLSDVLAAISEGVAWLALCLVALATYRRQRQRQPRSIDGSRPRPSVQSR